VSSPSPDSEPFQAESHGLGDCFPNEDHDQDLVDWLASKGVRPPDWSFDASLLDPVERANRELQIPIRTPGGTIVPGVYLFYDRTPLTASVEPGDNRIVPLYVGKAANLWNRIQSHFCRPMEGAWLQIFLEDAEKGLFDGMLMVCAWKEEERAGIEARMIQILRPMYCRRRE